MSILRNLFNALSYTRLSETDILDKVRYTVGLARREGAVRNLSKEDWLTAAADADAIARNYKMLASASALILRRRYEVSERELADTLGWHRTTLRGRLDMERVRSLADALTRTLGNEELICPHNGRSSKTARETPRI